MAVSQGATGSTSAVGAATHAVIAYNEASSDVRRRSAALPSAKRIDTSAITTLIGLPLDGFVHIAEPYNISLAENLVADLTCDKVAWEPAIRLGACNILKELSRLPGPSRVLAAPGEIERIQGLVVCLKQRISRRPSTVAGSLMSSRGTGDFGDKDRGETLQQLDVSLRILNNILVQHPSARTAFAASNENMRTAIDLIDKPGTPMLVFLCARLVFFASLGPSEALKNAVQDFGLVDTFARRLSALLHEGQSSEVEMAVSELLKAFFNVGLFYPKVDSAAGSPAVVGESYDDALLPFLAPSIAVLTGWRTKPEAVLRAPQSHAIAVLLNYPVATFEHTCAGVVSTAPAALSASSSSTSFSNAKTRSGSWDGVTDQSAGVSSAKSRSRKIAAALLRGPTFSSPFGSNAKNGAAESHALERPIVTTMLDLVETFLLRYFASHDVDDGTANRIAEREEADLESLGEPPLLLLRKLLSESTTFRATAKNRILPANIDRTIGLDKRPDVTGILIRLMGSHSFPRLARASGEMLMAMCGGQATQMTSEIGYGPCAGFLMSIGQSFGMPGTGNEPGKTDGQGRPVDPITGKVLPTEEEIARQDVESGLSAMTMDEKEAEAERLFGLFDRLDRTGVMKVDRSSHPIHRAVDSGRFQEIDEQDELEQRQALQREEEETKREVEREMRAFKARKAALSGATQERSAGEGT